MFRPAYTRVDDPARLAAFVADYPFGILTTSGKDGEPMATHIPFLFRAPGEAQAGPAGLLLGHMARANPHWKALDGERPARVIFPGPHGYISPSLYGEHPSVPTWNYAAVHAFGRPRALHDAEELWHLLKSQVAAYESGRAAPWTPELPEAYRQRMIAGIVGVAIPLERLEGKFKLSQNRGEADRERVIEGLRAGAHPAERELGGFMAAQAEVVFPERTAQARSEPAATGPAESGPVPGAPPRTPER